MIFSIDDIDGIKDYDIKDFIVKYIRSDAAHIE